MSITIRNSAKLYENYNINGKKEYYLVIECNNCDDSNSDFFYNYKCISCLLINIYKSRDKKFKEILIKSKELNINYEQLKKLLNYFKKLKIIKGNYKKIENFNDSKCNYKEFNCKISQGIKKFKVFLYILLLPIIVGAIGGIFPFFKILNLEFNLNGVSMSDLVLSSFDLTSFIIIFLVLLSCIIISSYFFLKIIDYNNILLIIFLVIIIFILFFFCSYILIINII